MNGRVLLEEREKRAKIIKITQERTGANNENKYRTCVNKCDRDIYNDQTLKSVLTKFYTQILWRKIFDEFITRPNCFNRSKIGASFNILKTIRVLSG